MNQPIVTKDSMAIIARGLKKMFKSRRFDPKKFYKKGSSSKRNEKISKGNKVSANKNKTDLGLCFGCGLPGHMVKYCPIIQKKAEKMKQRAKKEKELKRAMIVAPSDSDSSDSDDEESKWRTFASWQMKIKSKKMKLSMKAQMR